MVIASLLMTSSICSGDDNYIGAPGRNGPCPARCEVVHPSSGNIDKDCHKKDAVYCCCRNSESWFAGETVPLDVIRDI